MLLYEQKAHLEEIIARTTVYRARKITIKLNESLLVGWNTLLTRFSIRGKHKAGVVKLGVKVRRN